MIIKLSSKKIVDLFTEECDWELYLAGYDPVQHHFIGIPYIVYTKSDKDDNQTEDVD